MFLTLLVATVPTVGDAIEALTDFCDELMETLKQMAVLSAELDARDHVQVDDIRQVSDTKMTRLNYETFPVPTTDSYPSRH